MTPLADSLKRAVAALEAEGVPYVLGGGMACWARGGPESSADVDLMVKPSDAERALAALEAAGMRAERPPEQWLLKAYDGDTLIDLIFAPIGVPIDDAAIARGEELGVFGMTVRVMSVEDVLTTKLLALDEHAPDYGDLLAIARALREQVDWEDVRRRTGASPFARAFFTLIEGLEVLPAPVSGGGGGRSRVRVIGERDERAAAEGGG